MGDHQAVVVPSQDRSVREGPHDGVGFLVRQDHDERRPIVRRPGRPDTDLEELVGGQQRARSGGEIPGPHLEQILDVEQDHLTRPLQPDEQRLAVGGEGHRARTRQILDPSQHVAVEVEHHQLVVSGDVDLAVAAEDVPQLIDVEFEGQRQPGGDGLDVDVGAFRGRANWSRPKAGLEEEREEKGRRDSHGEEPTAHGSTSATGPVPSGR